MSILYFNTVEGGNANEFSQISPRTDGNETSHLLSQSVVSSGQEPSQFIAPPASQQILSIDQVRMSELIEGNTPRTDNLEDPLQTQAVSDTGISKISLKHPKNSTILIVREFQAGDNDQPMYVNQVGANLLANSVVQIVDDSNTITVNEAVNIKAEPQTLEYHYGDDSDVIAIPYVQPVYTVEDDVSQDLFNMCNHDSESIVNASLDASDAPDASVERQERHEPPEPRQVSQRCSLR